MIGWKDEIAYRLRRYTGYAATYEGDGIRVRCDNEDSFDVSIYQSDSDFTVSFDGWHEHFGAVEDALNCFAFGLSGECRIKVIVRGTTE
ncbi:hypothetical protein [Jannaschia ovalis]|uniref:Uncharacterized protein n=1 Tax=Jannaschia ovalis TaxID=3038773 RepID=A0ABY8LFJ9_9RHOB|nr:hypothetical protein [Jannaschia sp. GRR-S6-38]WGH79427.1 hypothetical protein P8627_03940 [Jannaschia sp. GRR-S6-38]